MAIFPRNDIFFETLCRYIDIVSRYTRVDALLLLLVVVDGELGGDPVHGAGQLGQRVAGLLPVQQHV